MLNFIEINRKDGTGGYLVTDQELADELLKDPDYVLGKGKGGIVKRYRMSGTEERPDGEWILSKDHDVEISRITEIYERRIAELKQSIKILGVQYPGERIIAQAELESVECNCLEHKESAVELGVTSGHWWICPAHGYKRL